jgi:hypothetical protein
MQTEYRTSMRRPGPGRLHGSGHQIYTGFNNLRTFEVGTLTVTFAAADTMDLSVSTVSGSSAALAGVAQSVDNNTSAQVLLDAMLANSAMRALFTSLTRVNNVITYVAAETGTYTIVGTTPGAGDIVEAVTTAAVNPEAMRAGIMVAKRIGAGIPDRSIRNMFGAGSANAGVTILQENIDNQGIAATGFRPGQVLTGQNVYPPVSTVALVKRGPIWCFNEIAMAYGDPVHVRHTVNGALNVLGAFRPSADGGNTAAETRAEVILGGAASEGVLIDFNLP